MTRIEMNDLYFEWMCHQINDNRRTRGRSYQKLLNYLDSREFIPIIDMDKNRAYDGIDLRYHFAYYNDYPAKWVEEFLDDRECSIFEMMVALSMRCEDAIMSDSDFGNRTGRWFWSMITSLGLHSMYDENFDEFAVDEIIFKFLNRQYSSNGRGGLFTVHNPPQDMRDVEIWYQMHWYLNTL